jgi:hypothetical protein
MQKIIIDVHKSGPDLDQKSDSPSAGHEHHTQIDVTGTGSNDFAFPSTAELVRRALERAKNNEKEDSSQPTEETADGGSAEDPEETEDPDNLRKIVTGKAARTARKSTSRKSTSRKAFLGDATTTTDTPEPPKDSGKATTTTTTPKTPVKDQAQPTKAPAKEPDKTPTTPSEPSKTPAKTPDKAPTKEPDKALPKKPRPVHAAGKHLLDSADGIQELMIARQFDGLLEERFGDTTSVVQWGKTNMKPKYQAVVISLERQLNKLRESYQLALPSIISALAKRNPNVPVTAVIQKAVQLLDQELAPILYVLEVYAESIKQTRDGRFKQELEAIAVFFEDAFRLYTTGELHCDAQGQPPKKAQLPTSTYQVGDIFMPRFTGSGLATIPGTRGPVGAHALQVPYEMLDFLAINLPLFGHEARHNVFYDIPDLEEELMAAVEKAIRDAHKKGTLKLKSPHISLGKQKEKTIDMLVKLMADWLSEVDADVVGGVLFSGEAFGNNMIMSFPAMMVRDGRVSEKIHLLRTDSRFELLPQENGAVALVFEEHPVDYIRVFIVAAALDELGFKEAATKLRELADFAVGDEKPEEIIYKDANEKDDLVIKFATEDLKALAPIVVKAIIRTPLKSQKGKSCGDLVLWNDKRQTKVNALRDILVKGKADLPLDHGSIMATYVGAAASEAYLQLVRDGKIPATKAAIQVHENALKMIAGLREHAVNLCNVKVVPSKPSTNKGDKKTGK